VFALFIGEFPLDFDGFDMDKPTGTIHNKKQLPFPVRCDQNSLSGS
jgi:hypothetical protein